MLIFNPKIWVMSLLFVFTQNTRRTKNVTGSAILQYGGYYGGRIVKPLIGYKYVILELLKFKNE